MRIRHPNSNANWRCHHCDTWNSPNETTCYVCTLTAPYTVGAQVTILDGPHAGRTATVIDDGRGSGGEIAVKGLRNRLVEWFLGYESFTADQLAPAGGAR